MEKVINKQNIKFDKQALIYSRTNWDISLDSVAHILKALDCGPDKLFYFTFEKNYSHLWKKDIHTLEVRLNKDKLPKHIKRYRAFVNSFVLSVEVINEGKRYWLVENTRLRGIERAYTSNDALLEVLIKVLKKKREELNEFLSVISRGVR